MVLNSLREWTYTQIISKLLSEISTINWFILPDLGLYILRFEEKKVCVHQAQWYSQLICVHYTHPRHHRRHRRHPHPRRWRGWWRIRIRGGQRVLLKTVNRGIKGAALHRESTSSIVWCYSSNYWSYNWSFLLTSETTVRSPRALFSAP